MFEKIFINALKKEDGKKYLCQFAFKVALKKKFTTSESKPFVNAILNFVYISQISSITLSEDIPGEPEKWSFWVESSPQHRSVHHIFEVKYK